MCCEVKHVPSPVIGLHVAQSGIDTTLRSNSVGTCREQFCNTRSFESSLGQAESSAETGTTSTDNHGVVRVVDYSVSL